jgi:4-hydroxy 2-oxovalerate aldolase
MIRILDCTLRDGAHVNGGAFGEEAITSVTRLLDNAEIDYIEVGFLTDIQSQGSGNTLFNSMKDLCEYVPADCNSKVSVMIRPDQCAIEKLDKKYEKIDTIRFAFHKKDIELAEKYIKHALKLGYEVCANPVNILSNTLDEVEEILGVLSKYPLACVSIVDTFGSLNEKNFIEIYKVFEENLNDDVAFGLHLHDNMLQAFGLVQSYIEHGSIKNIIVDSSLLGMGRAPGNLCTEIIASYANNVLSCDYGLEELFTAIDKYIAPLQDEFEWGYNPIYMITGDLNIHRSYGEYLIERDFKVSVAYPILYSIKNSGNGNAFNKSVIEPLIGSENK